jgi:hypothetical protein
MLRAFTVASATTAPDESFTVPVMLPRMSCAQTGAHISREIAKVPAASLMAFPPKECTEAQALRTGNADLVRAKRIL